MKEIQKQMKELRVKNNMTQEELGEKMHLTKRAISNYENGHRLMDTKKIEQMCKIFGLEIQEERKVAKNPLIVNIKDVVANGFNLSASHYINKQPVTMVCDIEHGLEKKLIKIAEDKSISVEEVMIEALGLYTEKHEVAEI